MSRTSVSICTPTYNRRQFIPNLIRCVESQNYPKNFIEWIILDDGTDKIGDLVKDIPYVRYIAQDEKLTIGQKRNILNKTAKNEIIIYFDDDDFHHPDRIKHSVTKLMGQKKTLVVGSSMMYMYFTKNHKLFTIGPYGQNHTTAGVMAFHRDYLKKAEFDDEKTFAEEQGFLNNYKQPVIQLNPMKTIVVFCHDKNTFDKNQFLDMDNYSALKPCGIKLKKIIKDKKLLNFFKNYKNKD